MTPGCPGLSAPAPGKPRLPIGVMAMVKSLKRVRVRTKRVKKQKSGK